MTQDWLIEITYPDKRVETAVYRSVRPHTALTRAMLEAMDTVLQAKGLGTYWLANRKKVWPSTIGIKVEFLGKHQVVKPENLQEIFMPEPEQPKTDPGFVPIFGSE